MLRIGKDKHTFLTAPEVVCLFLAFLCSVKPSGALVRSDDIVTLVGKGVRACKRAFSQVVSAPQLQRLTWELPIDTGKNSLEPH